MADQLNNTRAVCRKYYVHPCVLDAYTAGTMLDILQNGTKRGARTELDAEEAAVVWLLRQQLGVGLASLLDDRTRCVAPRLVGRLPPENLRQLLDDQPVSQASAPWELSFTPLNLPLMPEMFVERVFPLNVGRLGSRWVYWDAMSTSPPSRTGSQGPPSAMQWPPGMILAATATGWTLLGLCSFGAGLLADAVDGRSTLSWGAVLAYSLGSAWIWAALTPVVLWVTRKASFSTGRLVRSAAVHALAGIVFIAVSSALQAMLAASTGIAAAGSSLLPRVESSLLAFAALIAIRQAARYFARSKTGAIQAAELEARLAKTHLQLLRMQLQPHFLFNTLNTVAELVHSDPDTADQMITRLGRLLRLSLDHAGHQVVPLRQEIDFLRMYVEIEQVRFQDRLQIVWDVAPETLDAAVPTLLWHPVLENAIRHGVTPLAGRGRIVIASRREGEDLVLEIRDNGRGLPDGGISREGVGLRNIRERVDQLYGSRARFTLEPALGGGTVAILRLPYTYCEGAHTPVPLSQRDLQELVG